MAVSKTLYLECFSGISGDMTVGALLDLGADEKELRRLLESLSIEGYGIKVRRVKKCGIDACKFDVILHNHEHEEIHKQNHSHETEQNHSHETAYNHKQSHWHEAEHIHEQSHSHEAEHTHEHNHVHRNINDVYKVIDRIEGYERVKELSKKIFSIVAEAEAKAHGIPVEEVHFHEVGAVDSIVDIISTAFCVDNLGIEEVIVSKIFEGQGHVSCQHGIIPVPVPATLNIVADNGLKLFISDTEGEMITPTGAAITAALKTKDKLPNDYNIKRIGIGAGTKDFERANILRGMLIEDREEEKDTIWILETNIDDCTGEALGFTLEKLMEAGARDAFYSPVFMKKNRPAYLLRVICDKKQIESMESIIFLHTTTIGIRKFEAERTVLERRNEIILTRYGKAEVKVCKMGEKTFYYPEYESVKTICEVHSLDYQMAYHEVMECAMKNLQH